MSRHLSVRRGACALAVAFAAGAPAASRGGDPPAAPDPDAVVELDEVVVRVPRGEAADDPTAAATVIAVERFAGEEKAVAEIVATAPGAEVHDAGGLGQLSTVSIRGSNADGVLVLLDGIRLNTAAGGGVDLSSIPRAWMSRVEIIRGPEGAVYGAGALGGVVNVITRPPRAGQWSATTGGGSFGTFTGAADAAGQAGPWTVLGAAGVDATDGAFRYAFDATQNVPGQPVEAVRRNDASTRGGVLLKAARPAGDGRVDVLAQVSGGARGLPGWPYQLTPDDRERDARALVAVRASGAPGGAGPALAATVRARGDLLDTRIAPAEWSQRGASGGAELEATLDHAGGGRLRAALSGDGEVLDGTGLGGARARGTVAVAASDDLVLADGRLRLGPALRAERIGPFSGWSGKLGASFRFADGVSARASGGRSFRAPSFSELYLQQGLLEPNPSLRPEEGIGADAGLLFDGRAGFASAGAFATLYRDLIFYQPASLERLKPFNAGKALVSGIEAEAASAPIGALLDLSATVSYTYLASETLEGEAEALGKDLPRRPRHRLHVRVGIAPGPAELHVELHRIGAQFEDDRNTWRIPAATVWNAGASVRLARAGNVRLHVEVRNALDDRTLQDAYGYPLPGRMVMVTLRAGSTEAGDIR